MNTTRQLSLRRTLLFTAIGVVLAFALAGAEQPGARRARCA